MNNLCLASFSQTKLQTQGQTNQKKTVANINFHDVLSLITKVKMKTVYPKTESIYGCVFNNIILPYQGETGKSSKPLLIIWSYVMEFSRKLVFHPNHFVPLFIWSLCARQCCSREHNGTYDLFYIFLQYQKHFSTIHVIGII